jgi:carbamoyltransferase
MSWDGGYPKIEAFHSMLLEERLGPARHPQEPLTPRHENIAASLQRVTEEIIFHLLNRLHTAAPNGNVVLVGGCAMNSVANGKVTRETPFRQVYIPVGAADNGTAFGAAFHVWHRVLGRPRAFQLEHAFWGCGAAADECRAAAARAGLELGEMEHNRLIEHVVDAICDGKVVGWFQDRMEFGARALGSRSLLADPRRADMRDMINLKIKFREKFRPFAPSVLEEYVAEYFEVDEPSPFMERVLPIRPEMQALIPAVTHVDGSGRLQTVSRRTSRLYWELIDRFRQRTGVPMLLNTSLNENEPIVRTPDEAVSCFQRTAMDMLVMGNLVIERDGK